MMEPREAVQPDQQLWRGLRDLVALSTLPAVWRGQEPGQIAQGLAEVLVKLLALDFVLVELRHPAEEGVETAHASADRSEEVVARLREAMGAFTDGPVTAAPKEIPDPSGGGSLRVALVRFGTTGEEGVLVAASRRAEFPTDVERLLLGVGANQTTVVLQQRRSERLLRRQNEALDTLLRINSSLAAERDLETVVQSVTDAGTELTHASFGAFFYNVAGSEGESYTLYTLSGASREDFAAFPMPRNTSLFGPTFRGERTIRIADVGQDPRYGGMPPHHGLPPGHLPVRSYLATPVVSHTGEVVGGLFFGHPEPGIFRAEAEPLIEGLAAQAAIAIDNARLYRSLQAELTERSRTQKALREAAERKDDFLAMLGHELRSPLSAISSSLQILQHEGAGSNRRARARETMARQVGQLERMVDDLLDVSRISRGQIQLHREPLDLVEVIRQSVDDQRDAIDEAELKLTTRLPAGPLPVQADRSRLSQAMANLLQNACKFTDPGGTLEVCVARSDSDAEIRVVDSGIGIAGEDLERVLDPFSQAAPARSRSGGGLGLGLAVVKAVAELHGGSLHALSDGPGCGATLVLRLPLQRDALHPVEPDGDREPAAEPTAHRVLIVEDHRDAAESLRELLQLYGHQVEVAHDARSGLEKLRQLRPDVVLCDIGLPGDMDGHDVARAIRSDAGLGSVFLVALTGFGQDTHRQRSLEVGFDAHLTKPADPIRLERLIAENRAARG